MLLTRDCRRLMEDSSYLWIHGYHIVALQGYFLVAVVDLATNPVLKVLAHDGVDYVCKVGSTELSDLFAGWQGPLHLSVVLGKGEYVLDGEALELWNINNFDVITIYDGLDSHG